MKVVLLGTAHPFRGGLAAFNERLINEFLKEGHEADIITFTTQYPSLLFPGSTQFTDAPPPQHLKIKRMLSSVNPLTWWRTGRRLRRERPDILIIKYWLPFMAPAFGTVARMARGNGQTRVICVADNIVPHEPRFYDKAFTRFFVNSCDGFITMSNEVLRDLSGFNRTKLRAGNPHPLFDNFGKRTARQEACATLQLDSSKKYILFFGFIRDYKGLDLLLEAMREVTAQLPEVELIVAGEFYTNAESYLQQAAPLGAAIHWYDRFISDDEVSTFFSVADLVVQPYKHATQSGVTQIAYHFEVPMVVTNVGGLPELVPDGEAGLVVPPQSDAIAAAIIRFFKEDMQPTLLAGLRAGKARFGWDRMVQTILQLRAKL